MALVRKGKRAMDLYTLPDETKASTGGTQVPDSAPARIMEIEIGQPLPTIPAFDTSKGERYQRVLCLVRLHTQPLGVVEFTFDQDEMSANACAEHIWSILQRQINEHLQRDGLPVVGTFDTGGLPISGTPLCIEEREQFLARTPFVSVIVPTHDRPELLQTCLRALVALHYPRYEIIVVDNAPGTNATADFIKQNYGDVPWIRYVREGRQGISWARNRGIMEARGKILAFTDDDVVVDRYWLAELVRPFSLSDDVACVTGQILPLELETPPQFWYEQYGGSYWFQWGSRSNWWSTRHIFDIKKNRMKEPLYPYRAGKFGCGASMAFTAAFLGSIRGFDPALGGNGPSRCAQDIAVLFQVITRGYKLVYEPTSVVYHLNRREYKALRKQIYNYGIGMTAYLTKSFLDNPRLLFDFIPKAIYGFFLFLGTRMSKHDDEPLAYYPKELTMLKLKGMLYGPLAYLQSRWAIRKLHKEVSLDEVCIYGFNRGKGKPMR